MNIITNNGTLFTWACFKNSSLTARTILYAFVLALMM